MKHLLQLGFVLLTISFSSQASAAEPIKIDLPGSERVEDWQAWADSQKASIEETVVALHLCDSKNHTRYILAMLTRAAILKKPQKPDLSEIWQEVSGEKPLTNETVASVPIDKYSREYPPIVQATYRVLSESGEKDDWFSKKEVDATWKKLTQLQLNTMRSYANRPDELGRQLKAQANTALDFGSLTSDLLGRAKFMAFGCELMADSLRFSLKNDASQQAYQFTVLAMHGYESMLARQANENKINDASDALLGRRRLAFGCGRVALACYACDCREEFGMVCANIAARFGGSQIASGAFPEAADAFEQRATKVAVDRASKRGDLTFLGDRLSSGTPFPNRPTSNPLAVLSPGSAIRARQEIEKAKSEFLKDVVTQEDLARRVNIRLKQQTNTPSDDSTTHKTSTALKINVGFVRDREGKIKDQEPAIFWDGEIVRINKFETKIKSAVQKLKEMGVEVKNVEAEIGSDDEVMIGDVMSIVDICKKTGIENVSIKTAKQ